MANGSRSKGRYQEKRERGLVPLYYSEACRRVASALKEHAAGRLHSSNLDPLRRAHDEYLRREYGINRRREAA